MTLPRPPQRVTVDGETFGVTIDQPARVTVASDEGDVWSATLVERPASSGVTLDLAFSGTADQARLLRLVVVDTGKALWISIEGETFEVAMGDVDVRAARRGEHGTEEGLSAPMPATLTKVLVEVGAKVRKGETLVLLEAMKMEMAIKAPRDGIVARVAFRPGDLVQPGSPLVELAPADDRTPA